MYLFKGAENVGQFVGRDADACVFDLTVEMAAQRRCGASVDAQRHFTGQREFDGVAEQIEQHLAQAFFVAHQPVRQTAFGMIGEAQVFLSRLDADHVRHRLKAIFQ
ncbi:MAG: hypothetical protein R6W98_10265 [Oceanibaculum nanhaiense]